MTLYLIGLGLYDEKDITLRGLEIVKKCDIVYLEYYTSVLGVDKAKLEALYGREVLVAPRDVIEKQAEELLIELAKDQDVALLVVGDVFGATTHADLLFRAKQAKVTTEVVFNASIMNAIGLTGLELYKFGKTTSIVFPDAGWYPNTPYDVIKNNKAMGLHTLCLLDIKVAEPCRDDLLRAQPGKLIKPQPPRFMNISEALDVLMHLENTAGENVLLEDTLAIGIARLGHPDAKIVAGTIKQLKDVDFGAPLHSLIIPSKLQIVEEEVLEEFKLK
ncbi:diphthine synthase [Candidatus Woesearchaeota archaeon]|nr:diphthine synthase [Candidatus Woesearchaeota archaeon]